MDTEENESSGGDTVYYTTYEMDTSGIEDRLDTQEETLVEIQESMDDFAERVNGGFGLLVALFGLVLGFMSAKELFKIWIQ